MLPNIIFKRHSFLCRSFLGGTVGQGSYEGLFAGWIVEDSRQEAEQDIGSQLSKNLIDVQGVFFTHIHGDHTAGIPALPRNTPIIVGAGESLHHYPVMMYNDHFNETEVLHELEFDNGFAMPPFDKVLDVFGDQSLLAIATPGTPVVTFLFWCMPPTAGCC
jgi:glyoxylase-like metal-dependent hydrolase (beta-lactamase superfamily II)